jgi:ribosomal protein L10
MVQKRYQVTNEKDLVKKSNMIFIAPMDNFSMDEAEKFKKSIPENWDYSVLSGNAVIDAIDGTPFCLLSSILSTSNFCIFVYDDDIQKSNDILNNCLNKVLKISKSSNYEYAICRKGHLIYINETEMKKKRIKKNEKDEDNDNLNNLSINEKKKFAQVDEDDEYQYMSQLKNLIESNN